MDIDFQTIINQWISVKQKSATVFLYLYCINYCKAARFVDTRIPINVEITDIVTNEQNDKWLGW